MKSRGRERSLEEHHRAKCVRKRSSRYMLIDFEVISDHLRHLFCTTCFSGLAELTIKPELYAGGAAVCQTLAADFAYTRPSKLMKRTCLRIAYYTAGQHQLILQPSALCFCRCDHDATAHTVCCFARTLMRRHARLLSPPTMPRACRPIIL